MTDGPTLYVTKGKRPEVRIGDSWPLLVPVYDGQVGGGRLYGDPIDVSSGTVTGHLIIQNPDGDGGSDHEVVATKVNYNGGAFVDAFRFDVAASITTGWTEQLAGYSVEYRDSTGAVVLTIEEGQVDIKAKRYAGA